MNTNLTPEARVQILRLFQCTEPHLVEMQARCLRYMWQQLEHDIVNVPMPSERAQVLVDVRDTLAAILMNQLDPSLR